MLNVLLLPLLGGYLYLSTRHRHRALILRQSSYHLFFRSALWGLGFFVLARFTVLAVEVVAPAAADVWVWFEQRYVPEGFRAYAGTALLSLLFGWTGRVMNHVSDRWAADLGRPFSGSEEYETKRAIAERGSAVERLVTHAFDVDKLIRVSLTTDKYYIGFVSQTPEPSQEYTALELITVTSGYRDPQTKETRETENYVEVLSTFAEAGPAASEAGPGLLISNDFVVVLPIAQIVSVQLFDPDVYKAFQERRVRTQTPPPVR